MGMVRRLVLLVVLCLLGALAWLGHGAVQVLEVPEGARELVIERGTSLRQLSRQLAAAGLLDNPGGFAWTGRLRGQAGQIKAGSYALPARIRALDLLDLVARGEALPTQVVLLEGWRFAQLREALAAAPLLRHDAAALAEPELLARLGAAETAAEGLFFPDTYYYSPGSGELELLARAYRRMQLRLAALWQERAGGLPYASPYEALIMASLVEKETGRAEDRPLVAAVFLNRLGRGMRLQTDPSVIYGMGSAYRGTLHHGDLERDTPWNTYTREGLPPTPIAAPGVAALQAALHPARSSALYFVARGDGSSQFSRNLGEHNRAVQRFLRERKEGP